MSPTPYAATTEVSVVKSKIAIEEMLRQHGAAEFATGWSQTHDTLQFTLHSQKIRFTLPRPNPKDRKFTIGAYGRLRSTASAQAMLEQADRQRWRALYLVIRAKLEAITAGIAIYEQEFLAFIVDPISDLTVGDMLVPRIEAGRGVVGLLPAAREQWPCPLCQHVNPMIEVTCKKCGGGGLPSGS